MIDTVVAAVAGGVIVAVIRYGWQLAFPPPGRYLLTVDPLGQVGVDSEAPTLVHALAAAAARWMSITDTEQWPAALVVEVMPRPE